MVGNPSVMLDLRSVTLYEHPHLHIIVPSGTYDPKKYQWHKGNSRYLFNEFALDKVWRDRLLDTI